MNNPCGVSEPSSWIALLLKLVSSSLRNWVTTGCAVESLLLLLGPPHHWSVSRYTLIAALHVVYALASTSWLFRLVFTAGCWPLVLVTSLVQYAFVSRIARGRLRTVLKSAHFHKDRIALFNLPALLLDTDVNGSLTVRGVTVSLLDLTVDFHAIELEMDLGSGHELSVQTDGLRFSLFRDITIQEVYGVHWYTAPETGVDSQTPRLSHDLNEDAFSRSKSNSLSNRLLGRASDDESAPRKRDLLKEKVTSESPNGSPPTAIKAGRPMTLDKRSLGAKATLSRADIEAEQRYEDVLGETRTKSRLHQSRARIQKARETGDTDLKAEIDYHPLLCSDLRNAKSPQVPSTSKVSLTRLMETFEPISRQLDRVPIVSRLCLWFLSQSHKVTCPSICFSGSGHYLGDSLLESLFSKYVGDDQRIEDLKQEVSTWLSSADVYITLSNIIGHASIPLLTSNDITTEVRSNEVVISRIGEQATDSGLVASLSGADGHFTIPTCLLPSHSYLAPEEDTAPVSMSVRASLPAYFSDSFLQFATTLSKTSQMLDIEEEWSRSNSMDSSIRPAPDTDATSDEHHSDPDSRSQRLRDKLRPHGQLSHVFKHPMELAKQNLHREFKKTAVDKVDGAWMARWTNKLLKKLEGLNGDLGYTTQIPVEIPKGKRRDSGRITE